MQSDTIKEAERYLDAHVRDTHGIRHAATAQGLLSSWGLPESVQVAALTIPLINAEVLDTESLTRMVGTRTMTIARTAMRFGMQPTTQLPDDAYAYFLSKLRKLYICAYIDLESALLCIADRLAWTDFVDEMSEETYKAWAAETLAVDVPLLEMMGMWKERQGIADLALHLHDAGLQQQFEYYIEKYYLRHEETFQHIKHKLDVVLRLHDVRKSRIDWHLTTPASLYKRYERSVMQGRPFNPADPGILRVEVRVQSVPECYYVMGLIHDVWSPSASTPINDWIASPRFNGYRALLTTVNVGNKSVEFRLMTHEMADVNARGVTARKQIKNAWWSNAELKRRTGIHETKRLDQPIGVFSPSGEIYQMKPGSTVVDFAFRVHSELGPYAKHFYVNGKSVPFKTVLQHRDVVGIVYDLSFPRLRDEWKAVATTGTARDGIRRFLQGRRTRVHPGRRLLDAVLARESDIYNMRFSHDQAEIMLDNISIEKGYATKDDFYADVAEGVLSPDEVVADIIEQELKLYIHVPESVNAAHDHPPLKLARSWMQEPGNKKFHRSQRILPGTEIVGRIVTIDREPYLVVHRADSIHAPPAKEAIPLRWEASDSAREAVQITVTGAAKPETMWAVTNVIQQTTRELPESDISLYEFHTEIIRDMTHIEFTMDTAAPEFIQRLDQNLNGLRTINLIKSFKIWELFPGQRKLVAGLSDRRQRNPYTPNHVKDSQMFFGRGAELHRIVNAIKSDIRFIILHGDKRIGKTSLMYHLAEHVIPQDDEANVVPVMFDMLKATPVTAESFVDGLIHAGSNIVNRELSREDRRKLQKVAQGEFETPLGRLVCWVDSAEMMLNGRRVLFIVDEFTAVEEAYENNYLDDSFFQQMHHIVDHGEVSFMLCIHNHVLRNITDKLGDMNQRAQPVSIDIMEDIDARALIRTPLERYYTYAEGVEEEILNLTNRHPYFIHTICSALFTRMSMRDDTLITMQHLNEAEADVMRSGFQLFSHYKDMPGGYGRETLEIIAILSGPRNEDWASLHMIREKMRDLHNCPPSRSEQVVKALHQAGAIQRRASTRTPEYKIKVRLLHRWLRMGTSHILQMQQEI